MRDAAPQAVFLNDYTPPEYFVDAVDLQFELDDDATLVNARLTMRANPASAYGGDALTLDGEGLELLALALDGQTLNVDDYRLTAESLTIFEVPRDRAFVITIENRIKPKANTALEGLYASGDMLCTQCEAQGFRKITWFLDRPDVMSRFTATLIADKTRFPVLLSNGNQTGAGDLDGNRHWVSWADPFA